MLGSQQNTNERYEYEKTRDDIKKDELFVIENQNNNVTENGVVSYKPQDKADKAGKTVNSWSPGSKNDPHLGFRIGKQAVMVGTWICMGMFAEIIGPTLPDLKDRLGVNYEEVSRALIGKNVGMLAGSIFGGLLNEKFYKNTEHVIGVGLLVAALGTFIVPFCRSLGLVAFIFCLLGISEGVINTGGNAMVMHLWNENAASPMQSLHFGFGLGALLAPQIARPFLSPDPVDGGNSTTLLPITSTPNTTWEPPLTTDKSRIEIPYCIIGGLITAFSLVIFGFGIKGNPPGLITHRPLTSLRQMFHPSSCALGNTRYGLELFVCLFLYFIQAVGGERAYGTFLFSFAIEADVKFEKSQASTLQTTFWACHTGGRLLGILFARFVPVHYMIGADAVGALVSSLVLAILANSQPLALWIGSGFLGVFISICFPNGMSWANLHLNMNSMGVMVCMVGGSVGGFIYQYMSGSLFQNKPSNLMWVLVAYAICLSVVFIAMQTIVTVRRWSVHAIEQEELEHTTIVVTATNVKG